MIEFRDISKIYPEGTVALENVSFSVPAGEFMFLVGPSGAGKTTLVRLLLREEFPTQGDIVFGEKSILKFSPREVLNLRRDVGVVFQDFKLLPKKTASENVAIALEVLGKKDGEIRNLVPHYLSLVGLEGKESHFPHQLSGGEQQRLSIARAVACEPRVLVADEPTGNIDPASAWSVMRIFEKINKMGTTVVIATHAADIVDSMGKRVVMLENGRVVKDVKKGTYS